MKDIFKQYKRHKTLQNASIIAASLFLAIGVNIQFTNTELSQYLKSNIIESQHIIEKSDLYLEVKDNILIVKNGAQISNLQQIHLSLIFNGESLKANNIINNIDNYVINYDLLNSGILHVQVTGNTNIDLAAHTPLLHIAFEKNSELQEYINILNANFTDSNGDTYHLNASGTSL